MFQAKEYRFVGPTCEIAEYHWFHREKVELYMAELYNKIGLGLMGWSPVSFGLAQGDKHEDSHGLVTKLLNKVSEASEAFIYISINNHQY